MTLSTNIIIVEPTDPKPLFDFCLSLLARDFKGTPKVEHRDAQVEPYQQSAYHCTTPDQGLPAWLFVHYATDAPLVWRSPKDWEEDEHDEPLPWWNEHCLRIDFDTIYAFQGPNGQGCSDLHAWLVQEVGRWLAEHGIEKWVWENEFTGEWFGPDDPVTALGDPSLAENA